MMSKKSTYICIGILILAICLVYIGRVFFRAGPIPRAGSVPETALDLSKPGFDSLDKKEVSIELSKPTLIKHPNLRLEGTIITEEPSAYIRDLDSQEAAYYAAGDEILNATLIDIKRGIVTLDVEGETYSLYLESGASYGKSPFEEVSPTFRIVREGDLLTMVDSDEGGLKTLAEVSPYKDRKGTFAGYKVDGIKPASLAFLAGLRNGDIINRVNNQKLLTQQKAIQTFRKVRKTKDIEIGLLRESKNINLKYKIK